MMMYISLNYDLYQLKIVERVTLIRHILALYIVKNDENIA